MSSRISQIRMTSGDPDNNEDIEIVVKGVANMPFWKHDLKIKAAIALLEYIDDKDFEDYDVPQSLIDSITTLHRITKRLDEDKYSYRHPIKTEVVLEPKANYVPHKTEKDTYLVSSTISNAVSYVDCTEHHRILSVISKIKDGKEESVTIKWKDKIQEQYCGVDRYSNLIENAKNQNLDAVLNKD